MRIPKVGVVYNPQRKNWIVQYTLFDKRVRRSKETRREAEVLARKFQDLLEEGKDPLKEYENKRRKEKASNTTLAEFYDSFFRLYGRHQSKGTQGIYSAAMKSFSKTKYHGQRIDCYPLGGIDKKMVVNYREAKLERGEVSVATVNRYTINVLKVMLEKAVEWGYLGENPLKGLKPLRENNRRTVNLKPKDIGRLLKSLPDNIAPIVKWAVYTGMRKESILSLRIEQIERQELPVKCWNVRFIQKGDRETVLKLPSLAVDVYQRAKGNRKSGYLFLNSNGDRYFWIHKPFDRTVEKLGLKTVEGKKLCFHDLRRLFATWLAEDGYGQDEIAVALGQSSTRVTSRYAQPRLTRDLKVRKV